MNPTKIGGEKGARVFGLYSKVPRSKTQSCTGEGEAVLGGKNTASKKDGGAGIGS